MPQCLEVKILYQTALPLENEHDIIAHMRILSIETSCDDTSAALIEVKSSKFIVKKSIIASQAKLHTKYGGVVPEVAARKHVEAIIPAINEILPVRTRHALFRPKIDAIAVTQGPGLITSLHVGVETAKTLSVAWGVPLVGVNHIEGHIYSVLLNTGTRHALSIQSIKFPAVALIVSGGHTELILMTDHEKYKLLGRTRDDASGEAFDKSAKMLGLPYPGGPEISKQAEKGDPNSFEIPKPMIHEKGFEFSFSGMKNAIRLIIEDLKSNRHPSDRHAELVSASAPDSKTKKQTLPAKSAGQGDDLNNLCASIEQAIVDVLVSKSIKAVEQYKPKTFILAGGVSANKKLRKTFSKKLPKNIKFLMPKMEFTQDNAAMIAAASYHHIKKKKFSNPYKLTANSNWELVK